MEHDVAAVHELVHDRRLEHRVDDQVEVAPLAQVRDVALRARGQVVEDEHLPALPEQQLRQMGADEARAAGDHCALGRVFAHREDLSRQLPAIGRRAAGTCLKALGRWVSGPRADNGAVRSFAPRSAGPWLAVLTLTAAGTAAALGYALTAPKQYRATAQLLVSPVAVSDPNFTGLDVLRDTGGKRTAAATAAALLRSPPGGEVGRADLGLARSHDSLLEALDSHVVDSSDVVAVTVEDTSAAGAAQLANAFADALVKQRTAGFQSQLAATIRRDQQLLDSMPAARRAAAQGAALEQRLTTL